MSEPKLISPMLDRFVMGNPISDHHGVRCCPAMEDDTNNKYIVKIISVPASQSQLDALLLTGAYSSQEAAVAYFKTVADGVAEEVDTLQKLSQLEGFVQYEDMQIAPMEDGTGYDVYLLGSYKRSLTRHFNMQSMTHLGALNLGLDLCAALSVCRRSGYLYADLKPNNVFVTADNKFRIGDLGFIRLDSLKYTSLPDKYRSQYTAPEIKDAFSSLNTTIDVYAVGLILYQTYNSGVLPFAQENAPEQPFPAPMYADYEMAEIILKACAPDPADRWQDPVEMGQALVSYMQRNGAYDTAIVPPPVQEEKISETETAQEPVNAEESDEESVSADSAADTTDEEESTKEADSVLADDDLGSISSLLEDEDETSPSQEITDIQYDEVSDEVSDILTQVDDLAAHSVPDPVVVPEPIDIQVPDPVQLEEDIVTVLTNEASQEETEDDVAEEVQESAEEESQIEESPVKQKKRNGGHWVRNTLLILLSLAVIAAGVYYYIYYYLQPVESIVLEGKEDSLTVYVDSTLDESLLSVICADPHGNQIPAPVIDGKATFTNLVPDTAYTVKVVTESFHKLTGDTAKAYSTPIQSNIVQFSAITGAENGSAILSFTVDGPDSEQWSVVYSAEGEEEKAATFPSHMVTLTGLTVGKEYTFRLIPQTELYVTGAEEITFTAADLVYAENLLVTSCIDNTLTAVWNTPEGATVENWTVRCYNDDYNETIITAENTAVFDGLDHTQSFTVEVTAAAMSVNQRVYVSEHSVTLSNFAFDTADRSQIVVTWDASSNVPADGWQLTYTIDGSELRSTVLCDDNSAVIPYQIPGTEYEILIQDAQGAVALGTPLTFVVPTEETFSCTYDGYTVTDEDMTFRMCKTPAWDYWDRYDLDDEDYTTEFSVGQEASFLVHLETNYGYSDDDFTTIFVIRDTQGNLVSFGESVRSWDDMWYRSYCELDVHALPSAAGEYTLDVYFNGGHVHTQNFTIIE